MDKDSDDVIWGASAIAAAINKPERSAFHLLERGKLPAKKIGGRWVASRRKLLAALVGDEATTGRQ